MSNLKLTEEIFSIDDYFSVEQAYQDLRILFQEAILPAVAARAPYILVAAFEGDMADYNGLLNGTLRYEPTQSVIWYVHPEDESITHVTHAGPNYILASADDIEEIDRKMLRCLDSLDASFYIQTNDIDEIVIYMGTEGGESYVMFLIPFDVRGYQLKGQHIDNEFITGLLDQNPQMIPLSLYAMG